MNHSKASKSKELDLEYSEIMNTIIVSNQFPQKKQVVLKFLDQYGTHIQSMLLSGQTKPAAQSLIKMQTLSLSILKSIPEAIDKQGTLFQFFDQFGQENSPEIDENHSSLPQLIKNFNRLPDILSIKDQTSLGYYIVLENFLIAMNNIGYLHFKRNKPEKAYYAFMKSFQVIEGLEYASYFLKYHISTLVLNLAYCIELSHRNDAQQMVTAAIMQLEDLETQLERIQNKEIIFKHLSDRARKFMELIEAKSDILKVTDYSQNRSFFIARLSLCYGYYGDLLSIVNKQKEAAFATQQAQQFEQQLIQLENSARQSDRENSQYAASSNSLRKATSPNKAKNISPDGSQILHNDAMSSASFKTTQSGFTGKFSKTDSLSVNVNKENVIFEKYVEVHTVKFKIVMANLKELSAIQIMLYNKPRKILKKVYINFKEIVKYAKHMGLPLSNDQDVNKVLTKIARMLYFKDGELYMKELPYFRNLDDLQKLGETI